MAKRLVRAGMLELQAEAIIIRGPVWGLDQLATKVDPELGIGEFKADVLQVAIGLLLS
jgi:hypothetical protein